MDNKFWVVNASPLILLSKAESLQLLSNMSESVIIPSVVTREIAAKKDGLYLLEELNKYDSFLIKDEEEVPVDILAWDLGAGETQVLVYAKRYGAERVVLDDLEGRRCAKVLSVPTIGTLGIVGQTIGSVKSSTPSFRTFVSTRPVRN